MRTLGPIRSALFVPGNRPDRIDKAMASRADAVIIDLEDGVPLSEKAVARTIAVVKSHAARKGMVLIRVNGMNTAYFEEDLVAVMGSGAGGLMVPKVEDQASLQRLHDLMSAREARNKMEPMPVLALIESAKAVANTYRIAQASVEQPRSFRLVFGAADYTFDLGVDMTRDGHELAYPRARLAVACRASGLLPPLDSPFMLDLKDLQALEEDSLRAKKLGFGGKLCIHPNQVDIVNRTFSPGPEEIRHAEAVISAFEEARGRGEGAIQLEGKLIDKPVVERARQILQVARMVMRGD